MNIPKWLNPLNWGRKATPAPNRSLDDVVSKAVEKAVKSNTDSLIGGVIAALRGGLPGGWASDHREESLHYTGWNYIAINAIGNQVASADITVYQDGQGQEATIRKTRRKALRKTFGSMSRYKAMYGQGDRETDPLPPNHEFVKLLMQPNAKETAGMFNHKRALQLRLTGCCLVWNCPSQAVGANGERKIYERYVIPTAIATPVPYRSKELPLGGWRISGGASRWFNIMEDDGFTQDPGLYQLMNRIIDARQVQVIRLPHPTWLDDGQSPISAGSLWTDLANEIDTARLHHLKRGATPSVWWHLGDDSDLDQDSMDRVSEKAAKKYGGSDNTGKIFITQGSGKVTPMSDTAKDMCYSEGWQDSKAAGLALHQTPPVAVGLQEPGAFAAYAASMLAWKHSSIQPLCDLLAESDQMTLGPIYGEGLTVEIEAPDVQDNELLEKQLQTDASMKIRKRNEVRALRGLAPLDGPEGDELVGTGGSAATDQQQQPNQPGQPASNFPPTSPPKVEGNGSSMDIEPEGMGGKSRSRTNSRSRVSKAFLAAKEEFDLAG